MGSPAKVIQSAVAVVLAPITIPTAALISPSDAPILGDLKGPVTKAAELAAAPITLPSAALIDPANAPTVTGGAVSEAQGKLIQSAEIGAAVTIATMGAGVSLAPAAVVGATAGKNFDQTGKIIPAFLAGAAPYTSVFQVPGANLPGLANAINNIVAPAPLPNMPYANYIISPSPKAPKMEDLAAPGSGGDSSGSLLMIGGALLIVTAVALGLSAKR